MGWQVKPRSGSVSSIGSQTFWPQHGSSNNTSGLQAPPGATHVTHVPPAVVVWSQKANVPVLAVPSVAQQGSPPPPSAALHACPSPAQGASWQKPLAQTL